MSDPTKLVKAQLQELKADFSNEVSPPFRVEVQFNPETLKVTFSNQIATGDQKGTPSLQFAGSGSTKLSLQLWFDVNAPLPESQGTPADVRTLTQKVAHFITAQKATQENKPVYIPPGVRFLWGSFQFDGIMDSLEENLEFFSSDGRPQRASVTISLVRQEILALPPNDPGNNRPGSATPGTNPLTQVPANATLQGLAASAGLGANWQAIAAANGIENPRLLQPGQLINLNATASLSGSASLSGPGSISGSASSSGFVG